ncbi:MAG: cation transporter [Gammaproteobacteria bacterium]|nr:cation transporter [Gammaproteobacteria bacterium]
MTQRYKDIKRVTLIGASANLFLATTKVTAGWLGYSHALFADGIHSFSDLLTDALVLVAAKYGSQHADDAHPYGHARFETVATLLLSLFVIIVGLIIAYDAIEQMIKQDNVVPNSFVIWFAALSIIINEIIYRYTLHIAKRIHSDLLKANALHSRSDAASSLVVFIGVLGSLMGWHYLDTIAAIIVGLLIIKMGFKIAWDNLRELVDTGLNVKELITIKKVINTVPGVRAIHELRTRKMAGRALLDVHIIVDAMISVSEGHHIAERVIQALHKEIHIIDDVTVHIDVEDDEKYSKSWQLPLRSELLPLLQKTWQHMPSHQHIKSINFHYLAGEIALDIIISLEVLNEAMTAKELTQCYQQAAADVAQINNVQLLFK